MSGDAATITDELDALHLQDEPETCVVCHQLPAAGTKLLACAICTDINSCYRVCSKKCQVADWKRHRQSECLPSQSQKTPPEPLFHVRCIKPDFSKPPVPVKKNKKKQKSPKNAKGEKMRPCFVCEKECGPEAFRCRACADLNRRYWLCSKECQLNDWERHKKKECLVRSYKKKLDKGYEWYLEWTKAGQEEAETAGQAESSTVVMSKRKFFRMAHAIIQDWDEKILYEHGFVHWTCGDRSQSGMLSVQFVHPCDMISNWALFKKLGKFPVGYEGYTTNFETNMFDGLSEEEIDFIWENRDFFWFVYHDIGSKRPILHSPCHHDNLKIYKAPGFMELQEQKFQKCMKETFEDYRFWIGRSAGILKKKKDQRDERCF